MLKAATALAVLAILAAPARPAPVTNYSEIDRTMAGIQTAAGVSLKKRLAACKIIVHKEASMMEVLTAPAPQYGAKPGQTVLKIVMDIPPPPVQPGPGVKPNPPQKNVTAIWVIDRGKPTPISAWATVLQERPVPLGYDESNNC